MPYRILAAVSVFVLVASVQAPWSQESGVLSEIRSLRADLETFVIPADVEGNWRLTYRDEASVPAWLREAAPNSRSFAIRQYGTYLVVDDSYGGGSVQGDYLQFVLLSEAFNLLEGEAIRGSCRSRGKSCRRRPSRSWCRRTGGLSAERILGS